MGARKVGDYPRNLAEFFHRFPDDAACLRYLVETRWPDGFRCPGCRSDKARLIESRRVWRCRSCRKQTSATAGTILHRTKLPLTTWFTEFVEQCPGRREPRQPELGLELEGRDARLERGHQVGCRAAMVNPDRSRLWEIVEVDETWIGGKQAGLKGGRQRKGRKALTVVVAVERREKALGRLRLEVITDTSGDTLYDFIKRTIEPGSTIVSDAWGGYNGIEPEIYTHLAPRRRPRSASAATRVPSPAWIG